MATVIRRSGSQNWFARFRVDGCDYTISTGTSNKREAEAAMRRLLAEKRGESCATELLAALLTELQRQAAAATTPERKRELLMLRQDIARRVLGAQTEKLAIEDAWDAWLQNPKKRNPGPSTVNNYGSQWERFRRWAGQRHLEFLHEVTPARAEEYAADLWSSHFAPGTYNAHVKFLTSLFRVLATRAGLVANPWTDIPSLPSEREGRRQFTPAELAKVCAAAKGSLR